MGTYADIFLACEINPHIPPLAFDILRYLIGDGEEQVFADKVLDSNTTELLQVFQRGSLRGDSYAYVGSGFSKLEYDRGDGYYHLTFRTSLNYTLGMPDRLLRWLAPYSITRGFVGFLRRPLEENPDIIYFVENKAYLAEVTTSALREIASNSNTT